MINHNIFCIKLYNPLWTIYVFVEYQIYINSLQSAVIAPWGLRSKAELPLRADGEFRRLGRSENWASVQASPGFYILLVSKFKGPAERNTMSLKAGRVDPAATVQAKHPESLVAASGGVTAALLNE